MDTGKGEFVGFDYMDDVIKERVEEHYPAHGGWFRVGEEIELKGSRFRVKAVKPTELRLKLLKK